MTNNGQMIVFKQKKKNHVYAEYDENSRLVLVNEPIKGKEYREFVMIAGG
jgi:hypothetical protein